VRRQDFFFLSVYTLRRYLQKTISTQNNFLEKLIVGQLKQIIQFSWKSKIHFPIHVLRHTNPRTQFI
jgi:uncharacterized sodium:solute symporter family permease YidK